MLISLCGLLRFWICRFMSFIKFLPFSDTASNTFSVLYSFFSPSGTPMKQMLNLLVLSYMSPRLCFCFCFPSFFSLCSDWIIPMDLSSGSCILYFYFCPAIENRPRGLDIWYRNLCWIPLCLCLLHPPFYPPEDPLAFQHEKEVWLPLYME